MGFTIKATDIYTTAIGVWTTQTANDLVPTGLWEVSLALATLVSDPVPGAEFVTVMPGLTPGMIVVKTWKAVNANDTTLVPATTFNRQVDWVAFGR